MKYGTVHITQNPTEPRNAAYVAPERQPVFSRPYDLEDMVGEESPAFVYTKGGGIERVVAVLRVAGTTNTVVSLLKNGVQFETVTIPAGEKVADVFIDQDFEFGDQFTVKVTTAGTGAADITLIGDPK